MTIDSFCTLVGLIIASTLAMVGVPAWLAGLLFAPVVWLFADMGYLVFLAVFLAFIPSNDETLDEAEEKPCQSSSHT